MYSIIYSLPSLRKQDIIAGFILSQEILFASCYDYLKYTTVEYTTVSTIIHSQTQAQLPSQTQAQLPSQAQTQSTVDYKHISDALVAILGVIAAVAAIVKIEDLCHTINRNFMTYIIEHLLQYSSTTTVR